MLTSSLQSNCFGFVTLQRILYSLGIHAKVNYLKDNLHVDAVSIGPMYPTPNFNYGYNIKNFNMTCPGHYGNDEDFKKLLAAFHKKGSL